MTHFDENTIKRLRSIAPDLNRIEYPWKFLYNRVISCFFCMRFDEFRQTVPGFFKNFKKERDAFGSILTLKFHIA